MKDTITVIELLNKIANKEEVVPKRIKYGAHEYEWVFGAIDNKWGNKWCYVRRVSESCVEPFEKDLNLGDWEVLNSTITILEYDEPLKELENLNCSDIDINNLFDVMGVTTDCIIADIQTLQKQINKIIKKINEGDK